jgi:uncharacterized RDD family membrane protein YckC
MQASTESPMTWRPAGLPRRLAAACYDLLLLGGILMVSSYAVIVARGGEPVAAGNVVFRLFLAAQVATFFIYFWCRGGQTLGMRAWRIRVESAQGGPLSVKVATIRFTAALLSLAVLGLGFAWILVDPHRNAWHDRLSGTRVARLPSDKRGI